MLVSIASRLFFTFPMRDPRIEPLVSIRAAMCLESAGTGPSGHEAAIAVIFRPHRPSVVAVGADALVAKTWSDIIVEWTHQREGSLIQFFSGPNLQN
jgi:hypothetical protein